LAAAQVRVRIPMVGRANSLNVATSAAIVVYEAVRQRRSIASVEPGGEVFHDLGRSGNLEDAD